MSTSNLQGRKIVLIHSGGMDSTTLLYDLVQDNEVRTLGVDYGQRHSKELIYAERIAGRVGVPYEVADLRPINHLIRGNSSQANLSVPVPEGHYAADNMKQTVVPNRNMIMLAVAIGHAVAEEFDTIAYAAHAGDHTVYPDCRPEFASAMSLAAYLCNEPGIDLVRPYIHIGKHDIVTIGDQLGVPYNETWSCYKGEEMHCGRCGTCVERKEAFRLSVVYDPTPYTDPDFEIAAYRGLK